MFLTVIEYQNTEPTGGRQKIIQLLKIFTYKNSILTRGTECV